ncbi:hypothetical protein [Inconstantimicrobium porci]|uniref:Pycsar effector protein domain-containing protein n=1 Tax=Inconstantimicrobium porci TaxID=2652291 RepID=A0A7X2N105_9CLOT|nr:hypothetical protein [Inconstantimicrobium porci]MSR92270.1 hypothetical protein [Inconstantimicrobium porci]
MKGELKEILKDVTSWLNFAEAKNLALITFDGVWLSFFIKQFFECKTGPKTLIVICSVMTALPILISLVSFLPKLFTKLTIESILKLTLDDKSDNDNLLFYKDILKYSPNEYYEAIQKRKFINHEEEYDKFESEKYRYEKTLIIQIVTLSGIAYKKYFLFNVALILTIFSIILGAMVMIIV